MNENRIRECIGQYRLVSRIYLLTLAYIYIYLVIFLEKNFSNETQIRHLPRHCQNLCF